MKIRLDKLLVDRQLASTRERAQALILAGRVLVSEQKIDKPGHPVAHDAPIRLLGGDLRYVSRGGLKLEAALAHWAIDLQGRFCCDIGASTGGFTDCMLQHGAARVLAIDTGYGQIAQSLRDDPRVALMERTNARLLAPGALPAGIAFLSIDVSFISATLVLPAVLAALRRPPDTVGHGTREASLAHRAGKTLFRNPQSAVSARPETSAALTGHDLSRVETAAREAGASAPEETSASSLKLSPALKGHDFSRAETAAREAGTSAPEETSDSSLKLSPALKGHDFSRAETAATEAGASAPEETSASSLKLSPALKGHDFSRAETAATEAGASAPEETSASSLKSSPALKGHDFSRAETAATEAGASAPEETSASSLKLSPALKGHDFSRAETAAREAGASAPEENLETVILIKPQFEAGREHVGKGGIVRDPAAHQLAIDRVRACVTALGAHDIEVIDSPITGAEGNREFLLHARWP